MFVLEMLALSQSGIYGIEEPLREVKNHYNLF
jgi:hypothetical protein